MNKPTRWFHVRGVFLIAGLLSALVIGSMSFGELRDFNGLMGRDYHERLHMRGRCEACHESAESAEEVSGFPEDGSCLDCHRMERLVAATARELEDEKWQNPHDSLHYGRDVPCVECHGEHSSKEPLCADCHNFDYPNHQQ